MDTFGGTRRILYASLALLSAVACGRSSEEKEKQRVADAQLAELGDPQQAFIEAAEELQTLSTGSISSAADRATFRSCNDMQATVRKHLQIKLKSDLAEREYWKKINKDGPIMQESAPAQQEEASSAEGVEDPNAITNIQEKGVDEADFVKVTDSSLYILHQNKLEVIDRKTLKPVGSVELEQEFPTDPSEHTRFISGIKMYSDGERLTLVGEVATDQLNPPSIYESYSVGSSSFRPSPSPRQVRVMVFQTKAKSLPVKLYQQDFVGDYVNSRFMANHLYLVLRDELHLVDRSLDGVVTDHPVITQEQKVQGVPCNAITKPKLPDMDFSLTKVIGINTNDLRKAPSMVATLGSSGEIYMSSKHIYTTKSGLNWQPWVEPGKEPKKDIYSAMRDSLFINQIAVDPQAEIVRLKATGSVRGFIRNQFSFKEYVDKGVLAVATTSYEADLAAQKYPGKIVGEGLNHLWILKSDAGQLKLVNGLYHYGKPGEDIRAVRFTGDYAYMVTFKKTDPLYAINMSNPLKPMLEGELFIPGFSMYLHPLGNNRLLGLGYDADDQGEFAWYQGIQVSLFDASRPQDLKRIDNKVHGQRGSYSDVTGDHHAFFYDAASKIFSFPLVELTGKEEEGGSDYGSELQFSGAVAYRVAENKLVELGRSSHRDLVPKSCLPIMTQGVWWQEAVQSLDINRLIKLDGRWLSISRFGLKTHDDGNKFSATSSFKFSTKFDACRVNEAIEY